MREGRLGRCSSGKKRGEKRSAAISTGGPSPSASLCQKREGFFTTPSPRILTLCLLSLLSARSAPQYHATSGFALVLLRHHCAIREDIFRDPCFLHLAGMHWRGYVDILSTATEGSSTMNGGDFGTSPRIAEECGVCASSLKVPVGSLFGNDIIFLLRPQSQGRGNLRGGEPTDHAHKHE